MLSGITRSQRRFLRKCAFLIITTLFLTLVIYSSLDKIINRFNHYFSLCSEYTSNLLLSSGFTIDEIVVNGNDFTSEKDIINQVNKTQPIVYVSLSKLADNIQSVSKWVKNVSIQRILPSTLHIDIDEHKPFAIWKNNNKTSIIDSEGNVIIDDYSATYSPARDNISCNGSQCQRTEITEGQNLINNLIVISGQNSLSNIKFIKDLLENKTQLSDKIASFVCVSKKRWNIILDNGTTLKLPEDDPYSAWNYLNHLQNTTDFIFSDWSIIDMRVADKIFVKR